MYSEAEIKAWGTIIDHLKQENVLLKNQLSEAVKGTFEVTFLEHAEYFQQSFINKDQVIDLLRHDIADLLAGAYKEDRQDQYDNRIDLLQRDVQRIVVEFDKMKTSFGLFLSSRAGYHLSDG